MQPLPAPPRTCSAADGSRRTAALAVGTGAAAVRRYERKPCRRTCCRWGGAGVPWPAARSVRRPALRGGNGLLDGPLRARLGRAGWPAGPADGRLRRRAGPCGRHRGSATAAGKRRRSPTMPAVGSAEDHGRHAAGPLIDRSTEACSASAQRTCLAASARPRRRSPADRATLLSGPCARCEPRPRCARASGRVAGAAPRPRLAPRNCSSRSWRRSIAAWRWSAWRCATAPSRISRRTRPSSPGCLGRGDPGRPAQLGVERAQARADAGVARSTPMVWWRRSLRTRGGAGSSPANSHSRASSPSGSRKKVS